MILPALPDVDALCNVTLPYPCYHKTYLSVRIRIFTDVTLEDLSGRGCNFIQFRC